MTSRGACWSTGQTPTIADYRTDDGSGPGVFTSAITGLAANTTYNVRAFAANSAGTGYGLTVSFTTSPASEETVTDIDGNVYRTVRIGDQVWMAENLKTTRYHDGEQIPFVTGQAEWTNLTTPGFSWYENNIANKTTYGGLYNWYAVNTGRLAPADWHVPTAADWTTLINYLGGENVAGGKLKEAGTAHWASPNVSATNESGFTALPAGVRPGEYMLMGSDTYFWSASGSGAQEAIQLHLHFNDGIAHLYPMGLGEGFSLRCIRD